jgi:cobalt-zinc-cadmium efflux system outer membrane protein
MRHILLFLMPAMLAIEEPARAQPAALASTQAPGDTLTLQDALARALRVDPDLEAAALEIAAREALVDQAVRRPNPDLSLEAENLLGSGNYGGLGASETTLSLAQRLELGGKRGARRSLAERERDGASWAQRIRRADAAAQVTARLILVAAAQERLRLADEQITAAELAEAAVSVRVEAGGASPVERTRARVAVESSRIERQRLARELTASRARLSIMWGSVVPDFGEVDADLARLEPPPSLLDLSPRVEQSPDLGAWEAEAQRRTAELEVERTLRSLDLVLEGGARYFAEASDQALVLQATAPLPLFDRNQGRSAAAQLRVQSLAAERRARVQSVYAELATAQGELAAAYDEATALEAQVLPAANEAFEMAQQAYANGLFRYTDVLDAGRTLFELRARHLDALVRYQLALTTIHRLTGELVLPLDPEAPQ